MSRMERSGRRSGGRGSASVSGGGRCGCVSPAEERGMLRFVWGGKLCRPRECFRSGGRSVWLRFAGGGKWGCRASFGVENRAGPRECVRFGGRAVWLRFAGGGKRDVVPRLGWKAVPAAGVLPFRGRAVWPGGWSGAGSVGRACGPGPGREFFLFKSLFEWNE